MRRMRSTIRFWKRKSERREIDSKQGRATGEERKESPSLTSTEALKRASRRLQRRLDRAATARRESTDASKGSHEHSSRWPRTADLDGAHCSLLDGTRGANLRWRPCSLPRSARLCRVYSPRLSRIGRWQGRWSAAVGLEGEFCRAGWRLVESRSFISLDVPYLCSR